MKPSKPETQNQPVQTVVVQEEELNETELDSVTGGLSGTSMKGKELKPNEKGIIAILIG